MYEHLKIVVVEDDHGLNELMCRRLKRRSHNPIGFSKAQEAIDYFMENSADLLVTDMQLPDHSGEYLIQQLGSNGITIPYIIATGQGSEVLAVKMLKKGASDYLVKNQDFLDILPSTVEMVWHEVQLSSLLDKARQRIHIQNATLTAVNEFSPDGILALDNNDSILTINKMLLDLCTVEQDTYTTGTALFNFLFSKSTESSEFKKEVQTIAEDFSGMIPADLIIDGKIIQVFTTLMVKTPDSNQTGRVWYFQDITTHREAQIALQTAKKESETNAKMRSQFFAVVSHDVKTPLNSILGFLGLLEDSGLDEEQLSFISSIRTSGTHLMQLINDILDFSRIEHGSIDLSIQPLALISLMDDCIFNFKPHSDESGVEIILDTDESVPDIIDGDMLRLKQIMMNLLGNAMKFTREGNVTVKIRRVENQIVTEVIDTGIGISEDIQKYLFSPFTQASSDITKTYGGSGLGLAISRQLAERMGGTLTLTSELDKGSTFTFIIPAQD